MRTEALKRRVRALERRQGGGSPFALDLAALERGRQRAIERCEERMRLVREGGDVEAFDRMADAEVEAAGMRIRRLWEARQ